MKNIRHVLLIMMMVCGATGTMHSYAFTNKGKAEEAAKDATKALNEIQKALNDLTKTFTDAGLTSTTLYTDILTANKEKAIAYNKRVATDDNTLLGFFGDAHRDGEEPQLLDLPALIDVMKKQEKELGAKKRKMLFLDKPNLADIENMFTEFTNKTQKNGLTNVDDAALSDGTTYTILKQQYDELKDSVTNAYTYNATILKDVCGIKLKDKKNSDLTYTPEGKPLTNLDKAQLSWLKTIYTKVQGFYDQCNGVSKIKNKNAADAYTALYINSKTKNMLAEDEITSKYLETSGPLNCSLNGLYQGVSTTDLLDTKDKQSAYTQISIQSRAAQLVLQTYAAKSGMFGIERNSSESQIKIKLKDSAWFSTAQTRIAAYLDKVTLGGFGIIRARMAINKITVDLATALSSLKGKLHIPPQDAINTTKVLNALTGLDDVTDKPKLKADCINVRNNVINPLYTQYQAILSSTPIIGWQDSSPGTDKTAARQELETANKTLLDLMTLINTVQTGIFDQAAAIETPKTLLNLFDTLLGNTNKKYATLATNDNNQQAVIARKAEYANALFKDAQAARARTSADNITSVATARSAADESFRQSQQDAANALTGIYRFQDGSGTQIKIVDANDNTTAINNVLYIYASTSTSIGYIVQLSTKQYYNCTLISFLPQSSGYMIDLKNPLSPNEISSLPKPLYTSPQAILMEQQAKIAEAQRASAERAQQDADAAQAQADARTPASMELKDAGFVVTFKNGKQSAPIAIAVDEKGNQLINFTKQDDLDNIASISCRAPTGLPNDAPELFEITLKKPLKLSLINKKTTLIATYKPEWNALVVRTTLLKSKLFFDISLYTAPGAATVSSVVVDADQTPSSSWHKNPEALKGPDDGIEMTPRSNGISSGKDTSWIASYTHAYEYTDVNSKKFIVLDSNGSQRGIQKLLSNNSDNYAVIIATSDGENAYHVTMIANGSGTDALMKYQLDSEPHAMSSDQIASYTTILYPAEQAESRNAFTPTPVRRGFNRADSTVWTSSPAPQALSRVSSTTSLASTGSDGSSVTMASDDGNIPQTSLKDPSDMDPSIRTLYGLYETTTQYQNFDGATQPPKWIQVMGPKLFKKTDEVANRFVKMIYMNKDASTFAINSDSTFYESLSVESSNKYLETLIVHIDKNAITKALLDSKYPFKVYSSDDI